MLGRLACLAALSVIASLSACYSPPEPACGFVCGPDGACPDDYTCASDNICHRNGTPASLMCTTAAVPFDVQSVMATGAHEVKVTFTSIPDATQATTPASYSIPGLSITGTPALSGATVTLATSAQMSMTYTLTVSNVTRASDGEPLTTAGGTFSGIAAFDVTGAAAFDAHSVIVHFSDTPEPSLAGDPGNYNIPGLTISGTPTVNMDNSVTLPTSPQAAQPYTVTVSNVKRAGDFEPLDTPTASFPGRPPFDVAMAASASNTSITVKFSDPPDPTSAMMIGNYSVDGGLTLSGTPVLSTDTVTLTTSSQAAQTYTVTVTGVRRASDLEPLSTASTTFDGTPCPVLSIMDDGTQASGGQDIVISVIQPFNGGKVEIYNTTNADIDLGAGNGYALVVPGGSLAALLSFTIKAHGHATIVWDNMLFPDETTGGEIVLYKSAADFSAANIVDFVCWDTDGNAMSALADAQSVGKWSTATPACASMITSTMPPELARKDNVTGTLGTDYDTAATRVPLTCP